MKKNILIYARKMEKSGGVEKNIYLTVKNLSKSKYNISIIIPSLEKDDYYIPLLKEEGCNIYQIPPYRQTIDFIRAIREVFKNNKKSILHIHVSDGHHAIVGLLGKIFARMKVIFHSHNSSSKPSIGKKLSRVLFRLTGDWFFAVSDEAGEYMFGKKILLNKNYRLIKNGIETNNFKYKDIYRNEIRKNLNIDNEKIILGFIGRLEKEKNIFFLLDILKRIDKRKYELIIIGLGSQEENIINYIETNNLHNVRLLGYMENVVPYLEAFDYFMLPSLYESLGIALIEAQTNGLISFASTGVSKESNISPLVKYLDFDLNDWIIAIENSKVNKNRKDSYKYTLKSKYDINDTTNNLETIYDIIK